MMQSSTTTTNNNDMRKITTGLYTQTAFDCLSSVIGQLSDGIWENTPSMAKYWCYANISRDPDGQVIINVSEESWEKSDYGRYGNGFWNKNDFEVANFFADKIKQIVKKELNLWDRNCSSRSSLLAGYGEDHPFIEVRDAYLVYEILKGRSRAKSKYSHDVFSKVVGHALTPEMIEAAKKIKELRAKRDDELNTAKFEYDKKCADIKSSYEERIAELKKIVG